MLGLRILKVSSYYAGSFIILLSDIGIASFKIFKFPSINFPHFELFPTHTLPAFSTLSFLTFYV